MPTLSSSMLPPPKSWDEFEQVTHSALRIKWASPNLTRHGRHGQSQAGVDIYGPNELGALAGVQCKLSAAEIDADPEGLAKAAEDFQPPLHEFFFATASATDAQLQKRIRLLSQERALLGKFPVGIFFWGDLVQDLIKDAAELAKHFPQFTLAASIPVDQNVRLLALVSLAFYGLNLNYYIDLLYGEFGRMTQEDPRQFSLLTRTVASCASTALGPSDSDLICRHLEVLHARVLEAYEAGDEALDPWRRPQDLASEIEGYVRNVEYTLTARPLWAFRIGDLLARWNRVALSDDSGVSGLTDKLKKSLSRLFPGQGIPSSVEAQLSVYDPEKVGSSSIPDRVHALVREQLRFGDQFSEADEAEA